MPCAAHAELRSRIVEREDLAIGVTFLAHDFGAHLAKADAVSGAAAVKHDASRRRRSRRTRLLFRRSHPMLRPMAERKLQRRHGYAAAAGDAQKLDASAGGAMQHAHRAQRAGNDDAVSRQRALQLALGHFAAPLRAAVADAVVVGVLLQIGRAALRRCPG